MEQKILAGMDGAVSSQRAEAELYKTEELMAIFNEIKGDISISTAQIERESPLFRDSSASGQLGLFKGR